MNTLNNYISSLVRSYHKNYELDVDLLSDFDKSDFAMKLLAEDDFDLYALHSKDFNKTLTSMMTVGTDDTKKDFADAVRETLVDYYKDIMQEMIDDHLSNMQYDDNIENGLKPHRYVDNGEIVWRKGA